MNDYESDKIQISLEVLLAKNPLEKLEILCDPQRRVWPWCLQDAVKSRSRECIESARKGLGSLAQDRADVDLHCDLALKLIGDDAADPNDQPLSGELPDLSAFAEARDISEGEAIVLAGILAPDLTLSEAIQERIRALEEKPALQPVRFRVLLKQEVKPGEAIGKLAYITLRARFGDGRLRPAPEMAFVHRNEDWKKAETAALEAVKRLGLLPGKPDFDIAWSLRMQGGEICPPLYGGSGGTAFALGMAAFLAEDDNEPWSKLSLGSIAVTATIGPQKEGQNDPLQLGTIAGEWEKLCEAARERSFPCISVVAFAQDQFESLPNSEKWSHAEFADKTTLKFVRQVEKSDREFFVLGAPDLRELANRLNTLRRKRNLGDILSTHEPNADPWFVPRTDIDEAVDKWLNDPQNSEALAIIGPTGTGKTTWLAGYLRRQRQKGLSPVAHFADHSQTRDDIAKSLYLQLRENYAIPEPVNPSANWTHGLPELLEKVEKQLEKGGPDMPRQEVLYIDGAGYTSDGESLWPDLAGSNHAFRHIRFVFVGRQYRMHWQGASKVKEMDFLDPVVKTAVPVAKP